MNIVCIGGGPAGLYFSLLRKQSHPEDRVIVIEQRPRDRTYGWGLVFSDQAMASLSAADATSANTIQQNLVHWDEIAIHFGGKTMRSGGHGFAGIARQRLLDILQERCEQSGVELVFGQDGAEVQALATQFNADLVIASDGLNSGTRERYRDAFEPSMEWRHCRYIWLGSTLPLSAFTFAFEKTGHGWFQMHAYPHARQGQAPASTVIIETPEAVWRAAGLDRMTTAESVAYCEQLFAAHLQGHRLLRQDDLPPDSEQSWPRFGRLNCAQWVHALAVNGQSLPLVLMGDAAHSLHFSIGSGTRLAMEDAIALNQALNDMPLLSDALYSYEQARRLEILRLQNAATNSMEWFENVGRYVHFSPEQFAYSLLTRSQRISHENLRLRDSAYVEHYEQQLARTAYEAAGLGQPKTSRSIPPMLTPFRVRDITLKNRIVVSPMAQYSASDGLVGDYHLVHLGSRAMGGAGLVFAEMTCVSADARITPGCPGLYHPSHTDAWRRIVAFIHAHTDAKVAIQLGHAGAKGATKPLWEGMDMPLDDADWPLVAASGQQYLPGISQWAQAATPADMERIQADFVRAAQQADAAGFDWLELHCAHGYLLSSFISPLTNRRSDNYGGTLENRCRYPLEVFAAIRAVWPQHKPISIRISAHDWVEGGITPDDAVQIARLFKQAGADMIACSSGQVSKAEKPSYGRMYQTPFADRIRNEAGIATIAVGSIYEADHANSIIAAGRADLCAIARPHLANPHWTLNEAARTGFTDIAWPRQYVSGKSQLERNYALRPQQEAQPLLDEEGGKVMAPLHGKHALVTGGSGGIGAAIAGALLQRGARVTLLGRTADTLRQTQEHLGALGEVAHVVADITDRSQVEHAIRQANAQLGNIEILINNAGQAASAPFLKTDEPLWQRMLNVNLTGSYHCLQAVLPAMQSAGWGRIVNVASSAGLQGYAYVAAYCAAKHGVVGLTRALAMELDGSGVTINAVCPGYTDTPMLRESIAQVAARTGQAAETITATLASQNMSGQLLSPQEVAQAVVSFCLPEAAQRNGEILSLETTSPE